MKKIIPAILLLTLGAMLFAAEPVKLPPKEKFHLVLLTGQSNMAGRGVVTPEDKVPHPRVLMQDKAGEWVPAVDPVHYDKSMAGVGPARTFANLLADSDHSITVGLVPAACGGSPISSWEPGKKWEQTNSHPYDDAIARARKAMQDGTLKVILFHQGEADCGDAPSKLYHDRLLTFFKSLRTELDAPEVPIIIGQLSKFPGSKPWSEGKKRVDAAHRAMTQELPNVGFAESDGLTQNPDNIHFDAESQKEFGKRYYEAFRQLRASTHATDSGASER